MVALLSEVRARKRPSSAGITDCVDHDDDVAGMKEAAMVNHNQDTISAIHKIVVVFCKFFVSSMDACVSLRSFVFHASQQFAPSYASSLYTNSNDPFSGLQFAC